MRKILLVIFLLSIIFCSHIVATKIMVVQSYDNDYIWSKELLDGIQTVLSDPSFEWKVFYMDTRIQTSEEWKIKSGVLASEEASVFNPDILIACDDNAMEYFAKDYLDAPVIFCGVNLDPSVHYSTNANQTGVKEVIFARETNSMILELFPEIETIRFIGDNSETFEGMKEQLQNLDFKDKPVEIEGFKVFDDWKKYVEGVSRREAVVLLTVRTIEDISGNTVNARDVIQWTVENSSGPVFGVSDFIVRDGAVGGVVNPGFEEGKQAAILASRILSGSSASEIEIETSKNPKTLLNIEALGKWNIELNIGWTDIVDEVITDWSIPAQSILNLIMTSFEERLLGIMSSLRILASCGEVKSGDWSFIRPMLEKFNMEYEGLGLYILADGGYYTVQRDWTGLNLANRGYFPDLLEGKEVLGYQVLSRSTGKRSIVFAVPVKDNGEISAFVGLSAFFDNWNFSLIERLILLPDIHFYVFDAQNSLAMTDETALLLGSLDYPVVGLSERLKGLSTDNGSLIYSNGESLNTAYFKKSTHGGWTFVISKSIDDVAEKKDMDLLLKSVQKKIQEQFNIMDSSLAKGAEDIRRVLQDPSGVRKILKDLYLNNPQVVNVSFIDMEGVLKYIYPDEFDYVEGDWIGDQEQVVELHRRGLPVLSQSFVAVEGFPALDLEWPVFTKEGQLSGSLSFLIKPETFLAPLIMPNNYEPYEFWVMQPDGLIFYDQDEMEIGRNLFADRLYEPFEELRVLGTEITQKESGVGEYSFFSRGMDLVVVKEVRWSSVGLHGTQWRLILTKSK
ncbi:MAG TPA: hypothetical protein ENN47_08785 [Mesotoga infera]|uniref:Dret-0059-like sensor domain-containing protein n=1 Tax=Mesotoga infera TaxID=1236046 RepID=A0A7C1GRN5_9BACT|nr:hypothetical protein [Mesotoga infera]